MAGNTYFGGMAIPSHAIKYLEQQLSATVNRETFIRHVSAVSGGDISAAYCVHTNGCEMMLKVNKKEAYPLMFQRESEGLAAIRKTKAIAVPDVILQTDFEDDSFLVLEWIEHQSPKPDVSVLLGRQLAAMHKTTAKQFGFDTGNYMGSLPQSNKRHDKWSAFFTEERLQPMVKIAADKNHLSKPDIINFESLYKRLPDLFGEEPPALLHGDLWGGNYLTGTNGKPYLIDPAVSFGNREFDIAMTTLFGGFSREFYQAYQEAYPLAKDWELRADLWNLYPLLLHLNLFGESYLGM